MNTNEVVTKLLGYIAKGENITAEEELYAQDVVSYEQDGRVAHGLEAVIAKTKAAMEVMQVHSGGVTEHWVGDKNFLLKFEMDIEMGGNRMNVVEYGFYKLNDEGKVCEEYFYMQPSA